MKRLLTLLWVILIGFSTATSQTIREEYPNSTVVWTSDIITLGDSTTTHYMYTTFVKSVSKDTTIYSIVFAFPSGFYPDPLEGICILMGTIHYHGAVFAKKQPQLPNGKRYALIAYSITRKELCKLTDLAEEGRTLYIELMEWETGTIYKLTYKSSHLAILIEFANTIGIPPKNRRKRI